MTTLMKLYHAMISFVVFLFTDYKKIDMEVLKKEPLLYKAGTGLDVEKLTSLTVREWAFYLISLQDGLLWAGYARKLRLHKKRRNKEHYSVRFLYTLMTRDQRERFLLLDTPVFRDYQWENERLLRAFAIDCPLEYKHLLDVAEKYHMNCHFSEARSVILLLAVLQLNRIEQWREIMVKNRIPEEFYTSNFAVA